MASPSLERNASSGKVSVTLGTYGHTDHRSIQISRGHVNGLATITFERTLRVPDNKVVNNLPPSLGQFPLFSVQDYKDRMPADMAKKGGIFLPMYQREAMWINFSATQPFAIKLYVGGVNAISGVSINETPEAMIKRLQISEKVKQDYVVLPEQPWLDGIASDDGRIRQFVAMPKGSGYSVEVQVTGEEKIGGLQLEITPAKLGCPMPMRTKLYEHTYSFNSPAEKALDLREKGLSDSSTVLDLKKVLENEFQVDIKYQKLWFENSSYFSVLPKLDDDNTILGEIYVPHGSILRLQNTSDIGNRQPEYQKEMEYLSAGPPMQMGPGLASPISYAQTSLHQTPGMAFTPKPAPPGGMNFGESAEFEGCRKLSASSSSSRVARGVSSSGRGGRGGRGASSLPQGPAEIPRPSPQITAMSLAAGGLIKQSINTDNYPPSIWDRDNSVLLNVQLLNSESFQAITGLEPPASPIDAKTYASYGMPFYDIWNEDLSGVKGNFSAVKSVAMLDEGLGTGDFGGFWSKVTGGGEEKEDKEKAFVGEEPVKFPVVMLDLSQKRTFRPLQELEEEVSRLKLDSVHSLARG